MGELVEKYQKIQLRKIFAEAKEKGCGKCDGSERMKLYIFHSGKMTFKRAESFAAASEKSI